jgi:ferric-dicitrate binding protein FerR (iron transport regulator)
VNPHDHPDEDFERLARHFAGEATPAEVAELDRWLRERPERAALHSALAADWNATKASGAWNVDAGWNRLKNRIGADGTERVEVLSFPQKRVWWRTTGGLMRAAAVGIVLLGAGLIARQTMEQANPEATLTASAARVTSTAVGERRTVDLPDGSQVILAPASSITSNVGTEGRREIELTGEALFSVTRDETRPFIVRTATAAVWVLGTEFTVRALGAGEPVRVAVSSGSVAVRRIDAPTSASDVVLQPRDLVTLPDTGDAIVARNIDVEPFRAWTTGRLVFRNATLAEAIVELERWYDVDFRITDATLLRQHLDVEFSGQPIDEVLSVVGRILDVRLVRRGQVVELAATERSGIVPSSAAVVGGGA